MIDSTSTRETAGDSEHHEGVGHIVPVKILCQTGLALLALTFLTVVAAKVDFSAYGMTELNVIIALAIAVLKGSLVCLFFMHLRWDRPFNGFVIVTSLAFVAVFIGFAMTDSFEYRPDVETYENTVLQGAEVPEIQTKLDEIGALTIEEAGGATPDAAVQAGSPDTADASGN